MNDAIYMQRCLELAALAKGNVAPNPLVGAVLVYQDEIISEGYHHAYGAIHAEIDCLNRVPHNKKHLIPECTLYVNLEPCSHTGKTPPCTTRIIKEGIKKLVIANKDPFPKVAGNGIDLLRKNGITVTEQVLEKKSRWLNRRFLNFHERQRPYIILKWATTKNGFFAPLDRSRLQLSNQHSNQLVHKWRTEEAAIMVGTTTALKDNPQLTARSYEGKQPLRIVLDSSLKIPHHYHLYNNDAPTWFFNEQKNEQLGNISYKQIAFNDELLPTILDELYLANIQSVIIEGGKQLLESFITRKLWDEARVIQSETILNTGIRTPVVENAVLAFETKIVSDLLQCWLPEESIFSYPAKMPL